MIKYFNLTNAPADLQVICDHWMESQPILMIVSSGMGDAKIAKEVRDDERTTLGLTMSGGLSRVPRDSRYYDSRPTEKDFHKMCCDVEIKGEVGSAFPYANVVYTPQIFFFEFSNCSNRKDYLEDIFKANEEYHRMDTICFIDDFRTDNCDAVEIAKELRNFFNDKKSKVLKNVICSAF
jgi:hypothetical protein